MSKAKIIIEYNGKRYRVGKRTGCNCKRDCDLFVGGVCNRDMFVESLPCDGIGDSFCDIGCNCPVFGYKEIKGGAK